jgi:hypothetical protein
MDADAELNLVGGARCCLGAERILHRHGASEHIDSAGKIGDDTVAGGVEDATAMLGDQPVHYRARCLETGNRAGFVRRPQPAVTGDVGGEDRC